MMPFKSAQEITPQDLVATGYSQHWVQCMMRIAIVMLRKGRHISAQNKITVIDEVGDFTHENMRNLRNKKLENSGR